MHQPAPTSTITVATRLGPLHVQTAGSGPPAVLWHSLFVDSTTWNLLVAPLAAECQLVLIDGPNHGGSPPVRHPFTLDDCVGAAETSWIISASPSRPTGWATPGADTSASCSPPPTRSGAAA